MRPTLIRLLLRLERRRTLLGILAASVVVGMLDVVTLALIFPLLLIMTAPGIGLDPSRLPGPLRAVLGDDFATDAFYGLALALVGVLVLKNIASLAVQWAQTRAAREGIARLSHRLAHGYLTAPLEFHLGRRNARYLRGLRDLPVAFYNHGALALCNMIAEVGGIAVVTLVLLLIEPIGVAFALGFLGGVAYLNQRFVGRLFRKWEKRTAELTHGAYGLIGQIFPSIKIVKSTRAEQYVYDRFASVHDESTRIDAKRRLAQQAIRPLSEIIMVLTSVIILAAALWNRDRAADALPLVAVFVYAMFRLMPSINRVTTLLNELKSARVTVEELQRELDDLAPYLDAEAVRGRGPTIRFARLLELKGVGYSYPKSKRPAVLNVDLTIRFGEVLGLAGISGAGKSTLVDILLGLLEPTSGEILVDGGPPRRDGVDRATVGYVPQNTPMVNATIRENVAFGVAPEAIDEALVTEAIRDANLEPLIGRLPKGLDTEVGEFGTRFSGGQRQRIGIARALYGRPPLLILDEATSDLDTRTEFEIAKVIRQLKGAHTIILVAHRMHLLKDCDRVAFMKEGRVEAVGTFDELVATVPQFRNLATMPERYGEKGAKGAAGAGTPAQQAAGAEVGSKVR